MPTRKIIGSFAAELERDFEEVGKGGAGWGAAAR